MESADIVTIEKFMVFWFFGFLVFWFFGFLVFWFFGFYGFMVFIGFYVFT